MFAAMTYFDGKGDFDELLFDEDVPETYTNLIIERLIPADIRSISMESLVNFQESMKPQKNSFRAMANEFSEDFCKIEDKETLIKKLNSFKVSLRESNLTWNDKLLTLKNEAVKSMLYVGVPSFACTAISSIYGNKIYDLTALSTDLFVTGIATMANLGKEVREKWNAKKSNYYLEIGNRLTSTEDSKIRVQNISRRVNEFVND